MPPLVVHGHGTTNGGIGKSQQALSFFQRLKSFSLSLGRDFSETFRALNSRTGSKHPTPNNQHPALDGLHFGKHWMLGVRCWMFDVSRSSWEGPRRGRTSLGADLFRLNNPPRSHIRRDFSGPAGSARGSLLPLPQFWADSGIRSQPPETAFA